MCPQQQFGKIHQSRAVTGFLIGLVDPQPGGFHRVAVTLNVLRPQPLIFFAVDIPAALFGRPLFFIEIHGFDQTADQADLIFAVEDLEILRQPGIEVMRAQQAVCQTVECPDPHPALTGTDQFFNTVAHFRRRLIGKGH